MVQRLDKGQLISIIGVVLRPKGKGFSSEEINQKLLLFCANCPDPVAAMRLVIECMTPKSAEELVDRALAMPQRHARDVPASELPLSHPLRQMSIASE
jgi:hypothetical protein